mgnify:CR=1 FL=1
MQNKIDTHSYSITSRRTWLGSDRYNSGCISVSPLVPTRRAVTSTRYTIHSNSDLWSVASLEYHITDQRVKLYVTIRLCTGCDVSIDSLKRMNIHKNWDAVREIDVRWEWINHTGFTIDLVLRLQIKRGVSGAHHLTSLIWSLNSKISFSKTSNTPAINVKTICYKHWS